MVTGIEREREREGHRQFSTDRKRTEVHLFDTESLRK